MGTSINTAMRFFELNENIANTLYHVTATKNIPGIKAKGLLMMQPSNWIKAADKERYGQGEIYAFENETDAHRWAAKMDWEFNKTLGSGKISVVTFKDTDIWQQDHNDPIGQAGAKGKWLKKVGKISPEKIIDIKPFTKADIQKSILR
jgi:hypothetical protein